MWNTAIWKKTWGDQRVLVLSLVALWTAFPWIYIWLSAQIPMPAFQDVLLRAIPKDWQRLSGVPFTEVATHAGRVALAFVDPVVVLAAVQAAAWSRYLRRAMRETIGRPFMNAARVRGVSERGVLWHHALPNALGPFITVVLLDAAMMASGAVVTESVFAWPGVGSLFTESLVKRDYPVLMAFLMCGAMAVMVLNLLADIAVRCIDPRTRGAA